MADKPVHRSALRPPAQNIGLSEFATQVQGALSPFGSTQLPMAVELLTYQHPGPEDRPHLVISDTTSGD